MMATVQAYINHGRWVADCPGWGCNNAAQLRGSVPPDLDKYVAWRAVGTEDEIPSWQRDEIFYCDLCGQLASVVWPEDEIKLFEVLKERVDVVNRNWYPAGYQFAIEHGLIHGQSVADLAYETQQHLSTEPTLKYKPSHKPYIDIERLRGTLA